MRVAALGLLAMALAGCTVGPKYKRPAVPAPPAFRGPDNTEVSSDPKSSIGDAQWSAVFREPELQQLIDTALKNNLDLRVAAERVLEQEAQVRITRSQEFPQLSLGAAGIGANVFAAVGSCIATSAATGCLSATATWTPDFWGLYRKQTEAARAQLLAQEWAQRAVRLSLVQSVATDYFQIRALDSQLAIAQQTAQVRQNSVDLTTKLESGGAAPMSDVRQAEQLLYTATSQIPQLQQQIQQGENALKLLLGETPGPVSHSDAGALAPPPVDVPVGLPSQLLERRPDVQQAEASLRAANAEIGVARAQFFPQVSINAATSVSGGTLGALVDSSNLAGYGLSSITQPIFQGGRLRGQLQLSERQKQEMIFSYQRAILTSFHDVSNALIAVQKQRVTREEQQKLVAAAQDATRLARIRYQGGATAYLEVLTTDTNLFSAQLNLVNAQESEAVALVQLYSALGGGWQ